jgi:hypothetical protein
MSAEAMPPASYLRTISERSSAQSLPSAKHGTVQHDAARAIASRVGVETRDECCMSDLAGMAWGRQDGGWSDLFGQRPHEDCGPRS